ncbi:Ig-like domain-containing protein [Prescottella defluvii]|uniref:Ig-like domain-containing protein n=1 Tax=Prescottella defluvii TaxID=1323361 RepID=UPI0039ECB1EF
MKNENTRRLLAGASAAALAVGAAASLGAATASAFSVNVSQDIGGRWTINRTIQNVPTGTAANPEIGSRIKVSASLNTGDWRIPTTTAIKDLHDACLTYVPDSSRINGKGVTTEVAPDYVRMTGSWIGKSISYEAQYDVSTSCAVGVDILSSVHVGANQGFDTSPGNVGPKFQITKVASTTDVTISPAPQADSASTLTATVTTGATGDVEFSNNGTVLGTGTINNGTATYTWTPAAADAGQNYSITAEYLGDTTHAASTSAPRTGTVTAAPTAPAVIAVNPAAPTAGAPATITVTGADVDTDVVIKIGTETVCTATVAADGTATCSWTPAAGEQILTATVIVDGAETTVTKIVTVDAEEIPGGNTGSGLGSLSGLFGSS